MSRADRWWRPTPRNTRPAVRARRRQVSQGDAMRMFETGIEVGRADAAEELERHRRRDEMLHRLAEACEQGPDAVEAVAREFGYADDGLGPDVDEQLLDEVERFLREQD